MTFLFFRKTRKLDILGRVYLKFDTKWSRIPKIEGFPHFFENRILDFPTFCMNASPRECKKVTFLVFFRKTSKLDILGRICPKFDPKWSKMPKIEGFPYFFENLILDFPNFLHEW